MELFKSKFDRVLKHLSSLTAGQRMLSASLAAAMVLAVVWWGKSAGGPAMTPLLDQPFSQQQLIPITHRLALKGVHYQASGDRVLVPSDRKFEALADLSFSRLLPRDTTAGFDEIVKRISPFASESERAAMYNHAKEATLSRVIREFPGVDSAVVVIDPTFRRHIGHNIPPSATVNIVTREGARPGKDLAGSAAALVAGAQADLDASRINVVIDGVRHAVRDAAGGPGDAGAGADDVPPAAGGDQQLEWRQRYESYYIRKISDQLADIPGVMVSVTVDINDKSSVKQINEVDAAKTLTREKRSRVQSKSATRPAAPPMANAGMSLPAPTSQGSEPPEAVPTRGVGPAETETETESLKELENETLPSTSTEKIVVRAGGATVVAASVRVPRSYFVNVERQRSGSHRDPDEAAVADCVAREIPKIRAAIRACTALASDAALAVDTYFDVLPRPMADLADPAEAPASTTLAAVHNLVGANTTEITFGAAALAGLFIVSGFARKGHAAASFAAEDTSDPAAADGMRHSAGRVADMVNDDPDTAAALVRRWLTPG
jgi:flagellar biosynthesis/type III secretory pathway M-ring protein FliF/YscJ